MQTTKIIEVYIIEDQQLLIDSYLLYFEIVENIEVVGYAYESSKALSELQSLNVDLILLDLRLKNSDKDGLDLVSELKSALPETKILVVSQFEDKSLIYELIHKGIDGYRAKNSSLQEIKSTIYKIMDNQYDFSFYNTDDQVLLTEDERQILKMLSDGYIIKQIADRMEISVDSINKKLSDLRGRFNAITTYQLISLVSKLNVV